MNLNKSTEKRRMKNNRRKRKDVGVGIQQNEIKIRSK